MLKIFSSFSWSGTLRRWPYALRSTVVTALFLLGVYLILSLHAASTPEAPASLISGILLLTCACLCGIMNPLAALGAAVLYGEVQAEDGFMKLLYDVLPQSGTALHTLCWTAALVLVVLSTLWLLALTMRRLRDAGISRWNVLEAASYVLFLTLAPCIASLFQHELLNNILLASWLCICFLIQSAMLMRRTHQQDSDA